MFKYTLAVALLTVCVAAISQNFLNPDLNGSAGISSIPASWQSIPYTDPACQASDAIRATADICTMTGPSTSAGLTGNPYSGTSFVSGLDGFFNSTSVYHEGIMQTVTGLTVGSPYLISFYQTVIKQSNALDPTGSWRVYVDNTLLATSAPTTSTLAYNSVAQVWDNVSIAFTPTATTHVFKFLPWDDDTDGTLSSGSPNGAIRMGIDLITLNTTLPVEFGDIVVNCSSDTPQIAWSTHTERNVDYFSIQESSDGIEWKEAGRIKGTGNSLNTINYSFNLEMNTQEMNYYRIEQFDFDGNSMLSDVVTNEGCENEQGTINLFPNPSSSIMYLEIEQGTSQLINIEIIGSNSKLVKQIESLQLNEGLNRISLNVQDLQDGVYFIKVNTASETRTIKFIKLAQ